MLPTSNCTKGFEEVTNHWGHVNDSWPFLLAWPAFSVTILIVTPEPHETN